MRYVRAYFHSRYKKVRDIPSIGVEVFSSDDGKSVMVFSGKRQKPDCHYAFRTQEEAAEYIEKTISCFVEKQRAKAAAKLEKAEKRKAATDRVKVGDIYVCSWGYDQTNVDYYQVTAVIGRATVEIREIAAERQETEFMQGKVIPVENAFIGEPMRKRIGDSGGIKISSFSWATKKEKIEVAPGVFVWSADHFTAYA